MTFAQVLRSEVTKVRSLRPYVAGVLVGGLSMVVMAYVMAVTMDGEPAGMIVAEPVSLPMEYLAYVVLVIGALVVTSEHDTGTAPLTAMLVSSRTLVLRGKLVLVTAIGLLVGIVVFALVIVVVSVGAGSSLSAVFDDRDAIVTAFADIVAVPLAGVLGAAMGVLLRSSAVTIATLLLWSLAVETLLVFTLDERYSALLPFKTIGGSRVAVGELSAPVGLAVFAGYCALAVAAAVLVGRRRVGISG